MSYYTEREVYLKMEGTWGTTVSPATTDVINYLTSYEATSTENRSDEFVIGGARDTRKRTWLTREVAGALEFEPCSGRMFYYALGSALGTGGTSGESASLPCTITPDTVVPSFTIRRVITSPTEYFGIWGAKIDRMEISIEQGSPVVISCDLAAKDADTATYDPGTPDIDFTLYPYSFYHSSIDWNSVNLDHIRSCRIEIRNNLEARFSAGAGTFVCQELREQGLEVAGRLVIDYPFATFATDILNRSEGTLEVYLKDATNGTVTITINNVIFEEFPDAISGLDAMELDLPFLARKPVGGDVIQVIQDHPTVTTLGNLDY